MFNKIVITPVVVLILIFGFFGYVIYQSNIEKSEDVLSDLKEVTGLAFSNQEKAVFSWMIEENDEVKELVIEGQKIKIPKVGVEEYDKIVEYFSEFQANEHNVSAGTVIALVGYQKDKIVCVVIEESAEEGQCLPVDRINEDGSLSESRIDITVKCGKINNSSDFKSVGEILEEKVIEVQEGEDFTISLKVNLSTGYQWQPNYDYEYIEITNIDYKEPTVDIIGAPGELVFFLKALQKGEKIVTFSYIRTWEERAPLKKVDYRIIIK